MLNEHFEMFYFNGYCDHRDLPVLTPSFPTRLSSDPTRTDQPSMHAAPAVRLGCTDCHGGDSTSPAAFGKPELGYKNPYNIAEMKIAHPQTTLPGAWQESPANPARTSTLPNKKRSKERRVGKERFSQLKSRWWTNDKKK